MPNYPSTTDQSTQQHGTSGNGKKNQKIYIIAIVVIVAIVALLAFASSGLGLSGLAPTPLSNTSPIYLSPAQAQTLLGSTIINYTANYTTLSLYNTSSPINITLLEELVPQLTNNITNGWTTFAFGSGINNASLEYIVMQTANQSKISAALAQLETTAFPALPSMTNGTVGGMNYTYETYSNSTASSQILVGWKNGYVSLIDVEANSFTTNQTAMAQIASENIQ